MTVTTATLDCSDIKTIKEPKTFELAPLQRCPHCDGDGCTYDEYSSPKTQNCGACRGQGSLEESAADFVARILRAVPVSVDRELNGILHRCLITALEHMEADAEEVIPHLRNAIAAKALPGFAIEIGTPRNQDIEIANNGEYHRI